MKDRHSGSDSDSDDDNNNKKKKEIIKIRELKSNIIIICYYLIFKEKENMPPISIVNKKIIDYFTIESMKK